MEQNNKFHYTYSASQQKEIEDIRKRYLPESQVTDKMEQLRRLDRSVTQKASLASLTVGILGALILGIGMSCAMVWELFLLGIPVGVAGIILIALAYPIHTKVLKKQREKAAPIILQLSDELMK